MRILLVEDHLQYASLIGDKLASTAGFDVSVRNSPEEASQLAQSEHFDVIVVDVLYRALSESYNKKRLLARGSLADLEPYNLSGLTVMGTAVQLPQPPALVIWTSGDSNRALHLVLAHQEFGVRCFCSKESPIEHIVTAIRNASTGQSFADVALRPFLPRRGLSSLGTLLFRDFKWRAVWRALAAGSTSHETTARMTHYDQQTIRKCMSPMAHELAVLDPNINPSRHQLNQLSSYAAYNWEFFLDRAVTELYPLR